MQAHVVRPNRTPSLQLLRENHVSPEVPRPAYESEGSERVSRGSVTLPSGGRWSATLEVSMRDDQGALLTMIRSGPGLGPAPSDASVMIPPGEADALLTLLTGLIKQARGDRVLEEGLEDQPRKKARSRTAPRDLPDSSG